MLRPMICLFVLFHLNFGICQTLPELPNACSLVTTMTDTKNYKLITVGAVGRDYNDFQKALDEANYGTIIELDADSEYKGSFRLPYKTGEGWIIIRSSAMSKLPKANQRISTSDQIFMPKIITTHVAGLPAIFTEHAAHHYRFIGIEITASLNVKNSYGLVMLGNGYNATAQSKLDQMPDHIIFDRCYIHGHDEADIMKFGVRLDGSNLGIIDSYVSQFHSIGYDAQAVTGFNGTGPFKIINNYLEASGENVFFGGATADIKNLVPADIEIIHNTLSKPFEWRTTHPNYKGKHWTIKNLFELKTGKRVLFDGNILENSWADLPIGQSGYAILLTVRNENGTNLQSDISDITISNNIIRHCAAGISLSGHDDNNFISLQSKRIRIFNNIFEDIDGLKYGDGNIYGPNDGVLLKIGDPDDVIVEHNTVIQSGAVTWMYDTILHAAFTDNIFNCPLSAGGYQGMYGVGFARGGDKPMGAFLPGINDANLKFNRNILIAENSSHYLNYNNNSKNYFPLQINDVGFINYPNAGNDFHDYGLSKNSPYSGTKIGGKDPGIIVDILDKALTKINYDCVVNTSTNPLNEVKRDLIYYSQGNIYFGQAITELSVFELVALDGTIIYKTQLHIGQNSITLPKLNSGIGVAVLNNNHSHHIYKVYLY